MPQPTTAFIGAGKMATALAKGFVSAGLLRSESIVASDPSGDALAAFREAIGQTPPPPEAAPPSNADAARGTELIVLAVKPQHLPAVLAEIGPAAPADALFMSIAAGVPIRRIAAGLPAGARVVRVMPNTPCLIGRGASAYSLGQHATPADAERVGRLLRSVGAAHQTPENLLDAVTGVSGSGPAFVYTVVEALADAGVRAGLPAAVAADLAASTVAGAGQMVLQTGRHPAVLRGEVTSPGGTTAAGLAELERHGLRHAVAEAVAAAAARSAELGAASESRPDS
ncbi:MAG: pyrroline-5-carboxylate reductase [Planctomycetota bacterium]